MSGPSRRSRAARTATLSRPLASLSRRASSLRSVPMAHHKRHRPKKRRAGCLYCKPYKRNGAKLSERHRPSVQRRLQDSLAEG